jgi:hypothetical protein
LQFQMIACRWQHSAAMPGRTEHEVFGRRRSGAALTLALRQRRPLA